jgi:Periplasmic glucans biosynthesis protein
MFLRDKVTKLGVAPLTSMFLFGANQPSKVLNYRRELHDSSGLSIHAGNGEWIWRPLNNPKHLSVSNFAIENPRGFGLLQRGRDFSHYEDLDDRYDKRPSAWIEPKGDWGKGSVDLVEIPTPTKPTTISLRSGVRKNCLSLASRWTSLIACTGPSTKPRFTHRTAPGFNRPCVPRVT